MEEDERMKKMKKKMGKFFFVGTKMGISKIVSDQNEHLLKKNTHGLLNGQVDELTSLTEPL